MGIIFDEPKYPVLDKAPRFWKTGVLSLSPPPPFPVRQSLQSAFPLQGAHSRISCVPEHTLYIITAST